MFTFYPLQFIFVLFLLEFRLINDQTFKMASNLEYVATKQEKSKQRIWFLYIEHNIYKSCYLK